MVICLEQGADLHTAQQMPLSLGSVKSRLVLPLSYRPNRVVPDKGPLNGCVCVSLCIVYCIPEWIPIRSSSCLSGLCRILKLLTAPSSLSAMRAISRAWLTPFGSGSPETTMYASPIVSTCQIQSVCLLNASQCPATYVAVKVTLLAFAADRRAAAVDMASKAAAPPATGAEKGGRGQGAQPLPPMAGQKRIGS